MNNDLPTYIYYFLCNLKTVMNDVVYWSFGIYPKFESVN